MIERIQNNTNFTHYSIEKGNEPSGVKSLDTLSTETNENVEPLNMKEFCFMLLYNEWMQTTLLSDGLTEEEQIEW